MGHLSLENKYSESSNVLPENSIPKQAKPKLMPLYKYLVISKGQYDEFSEFLTSCFALENLLFFVQAITFRHFILEINEGKEIEAGTTKDNVELEMTDLPQQQSLRDKVFAMKFGYLAGLMEEKPNDTESIHRIVQNVYDKYISIDSKYQINISYEQRMKFTEFLGNNHDEVQDYLHIFDEAIIEVYEILSNVYRFQFKNDSRYTF